MKLTLIGSENRYALDQLAIAMFPQGKHTFDPNSADSDCAVCTITKTDMHLCALTEICINGISASGEANYRISGMESDVQLDVQEKQLIKQSFYLASVTATGEKPEWGCLSGVRPAKLARMKLESGLVVPEVRRILQEEYFVSEEKSYLATQLGAIAYAAKRHLTKRDASVYISIPFCPTRCAYCSFVSSAIGSYGDLIRPYLDALKQEIASTASLLADRDVRIDTVYIGGGTPTTLTASQLSELGDHLASCFDLSTVREYTVEAGRADTINVDKLEAIRALGVNRISINPQTMNDEVLRLTGRKHTVSDTVNAFYAAKQVGFPSINMDLIAGLKGDNADSFCRSIDAVIDLAPTDITVHTLALKKGADYKEYGTVTESELAQMLRYSYDRLRNSGYTPYYLYRQKYNMGSFENIGYTNGVGSHYNILMMEEIQTILSFGAGGVTKLHEFESGKISRLSNHKYPFEYIRDISHILASKEKIKICFDSK